MNNLAMNLVYIPLALSTVLAIVLTLARHRYKNLAFSFILYALMVFGWQLGEILYYNAMSADLAFFVYDLNLPFVALTSLAALLYVLQFYGLEGYCTGPITACLAVCPLITLILSLFPGQHEYLRIGLEIVETAPAHINLGVRGPWFWIHAGYCYILIGLSMVIALVRHRSLPRLYRRTSRILLTGMLLSLLLNCLYIFGILDTEIDFALVGVTVCAVFMYLATRENQGLDAINRTRAEVFNTLTDGILILDKEQRISSRNQQARDFLSSLHIDPEAQAYDHVLITIREAAHRVAPSEDEEAGVDYYIGALAYNLREKPIYDNRHQVIGTFVVISEVTDNRKLIRRLEEDSGMDALTGLYNRVKMNELCQTLDNEDNYPLAVICGDMNGLKTVNDTYGHQQGDVLLRLGAEILSATCPPSASVGRMGGDEFMVLLPGCPLPRAQALVEDITRAMEGVVGYPYVISMSLGAAVKEGPVQNLQDVIRLADTKMYAQKNLYKSRPESRRHNAVAAGGK